MKRGGPARCRECRLPVVFFRSPFTRNVRTFNPKPTDGHQLQSVSAFPVLGRQAYKFLDLVEVIQVQRESSVEEAEKEVRDMPWHQLHVCPTEPEIKEINPS